MVKVKVRFRDQKSSHGQFWSQLENIKLQCTFFFKRTQKSRRPWIEFFQKNRFNPITFFIKVRNTNISWNLILNIYLLWKFFFCGILQNSFPDIRILNSLILLFIFWKFAKKMFNKTWTSVLIHQKKFPLLSN